MKERGPNQSVNRALLGLVAAAPVVAAAVLGSLATAPAIGKWYPTLVKPFFTPPNQVFGPAWTLLYALMAFAFWRILIAPGDGPDKRAAIIAFIGQIILNALWSVVFFAWRAPGAALILMLALWLAIAVTITKFRPLDGVAAVCLAPYLAWTTFAAALNIGIVMLNG